MALIRSHTFEAGVAPGTAVDTVNSEVGGNAFNSIDGAPAMASWTGLSFKKFAFSEAVYIEAAPSATGQVFTARNSSNYILGLNITTARKLQVTQWGGNALTTTATVLALNTLYRWEVWGEVTTAGNGIVHFALFQGDSTTPLETFDTTTADLQSTPIVMVRTGKHATSNSLSWIVDDFRVGDTDVPLGPPTNALPVVTTGAPQNVDPGAVATVTSTASDPDGNVVSRVWTFDYPTSGAPALTNANQASASFVAGAAGSLYVLRHTATDNAGGSASSVTEVRVPSPGTIRPAAVNGTGVGVWTRTGGATDGAVLADEDNATYVESPAAAAVEANRRFRLLPSAIRTGGKFDVIVSKSEESAITGTLRLYEGNTLRQSWTVPLTTTPTALTLTFSGATIAALVDWSNLFIEQAVTT